MRPASTPSGLTTRVNGGTRKHRNGVQSGFLSDRDKHPKESPQRHRKSNGSGNRAGTVKTHRKMKFQFIILAKSGFNFVFSGIIWFQLEKFDFYYGFCF